MPDMFNGETLLLKKIWQTKVDLISYQVTLQRINSQIDNIGYPVTSY